MGTVEKLSLNPAKVDFFYLTSELQKIQKWVTPLWDEQARF
jgi:hypothetical protein